jgi:hypothetical protein
VRPDPLLLLRPVRGGIEKVGHTTDWDNVVFRSDIAAREFIAFWLKAGRLVAGMNVKSGTSATRSGADPLPARAGPKQAVRRRRSAV